MSYLDAFFIILGIVLAWPLISGAIQGASNYVIARMFPADKVNVSYTGVDGKTVRKVVYIDKVDDFFEELKNSSKVSDVKEK